MDRLLALPVIGTAVRMQQRYTEDAADNFAASIAFFGFLSLLPLILFGLSTLGFVLRGDVALEARVIAAVQDTIPGLSAALGEQSLSQIVDGARDNAGSLLSFATAGLLFTGLKVIAGSQRALAKVFRMEIPTGVAARGQQLLALVLLGLLTLLGSAIGGSIGVDFAEGPAGVAISVGITALAFLVDLALFLVAYRLLSPDPGAPAWRVLLPGAVFSAVCWVALKAGGAALLAGGSGSPSASNVLVAPLGILTLLYLAGRVFMYGAELSALLGGVEEDEEDVEEEDEVLVSPRPRRDVAPSPSDLAGLTAAWTVVAVAGRLLDGD